MSSTFCTGKEIILAHIKIIQSDSKPLLAERPQQFQPYSTKNKQNYFSYTYTDELTKKNDTYYIASGYDPKTYNDVKQALMVLLEREELL